MSGDIDYAELSETEPGWAAPPDCADAERDRPPDREGAGNVVRYDRGQPPAVDE